MSIIINEKNYKNKNVGKKAERLFVMREQGLNVPELICIDSNAFDNFVTASFDIERELLEFVNEDDITLYAVRSSSFCEDSSDYSFAGQFSTFLNVSRQDIADRAVQCYNSIRNDSAAEYCKQSGCDIESIKMSVIVQKMAKAEKSGVMFSANPQGLLNETVIVVGEGAGDGIVGGSVATTAYYYNRTDEKFYFERSENSPLLNNDEVLELINICKRLEGLFGKLIDVEFSIFGGEISILQCRPITSLSGKAPLIYDNSNIVESYPGITLPLTVSFVEEAYYGVFKGLADRVLKNKKLTNQYDDVFRNMVGSANGRIYYKISNWYSLIEFLPFSKKIIPVWQDMMGVSEKSYSSKAKGLSVFSRAMTYYNSFYEALNVQRNMKRLNANFTAVSELFEREFSESADISCIKEMYGKISDMVLKSWDVTLLNDLYAFLYTGMLKKTLKKIDPLEYERETNELISGISNIESLKPIRSLLNLSILAEGRLNELKRISNESDLKDYFKRDTEFCEAFCDYIRLYGDRSPEELKLETATFRTSPLSLLKKVIEYISDSARLHEMEKTLSVERKSVSDALLFQCGMRTRRKISRLFKKATLGIKNREISRLNRTRIYGMVRAMFIRAGEVLYQNGAISAPTDVFWLKKDEIFEYDKASDFKGIVFERKRSYEVFDKLPAFSRLIFDGRAFDKKHISVNSQTLSEFSQGILYGTPCSNGKARAEAVVIDDISNPPCVKDKIIITRMTDPGWVFLLANAKGIVSEKGSLLSHTAIISRELKIPAVVGIKNATEYIKTGDIITIDGESGYIKINEV